MTATETPILEFLDNHPAAGDFHADVLAGLAARPKRLAPKYFYDKVGSELFDRITELPEYYPTRTEIGILEAAAGEIAELCGPKPLLLEYGSGSSRKIRILLEALAGRDARYVAIDISKQHLLESVAALAEEFPAVAVYAVCADYSKPYPLPPSALEGAGRRVAFFPGSTIGNFSPSEAVGFLCNTAQTIGPGGSLLIGVDLDKDARILDAAYDDAAGVTAAFNLNLLRRINRELDADFDLGAFEHKAFYNRPAGRVEMHLASLRDQQVRVGEAVFGFAAGETIHTENSHKFTLEGFQRLAEQAGFRPVRVWTDPDGLFSLHWLDVR
ncbi:MAG: L-histidine N(alpha)-methyltransferase [Acidobacteria bacterium]|nr:L-histidine N(alpha)-methyltransferase [Acidobacteriota bacterium]